MKIAELIRKCFAAYQSKNRREIEPLLSDNFTFSSPLDDNIDRAAYFERCWPNSQHLRIHRITKLIAEGQEGFVTYECERTDGSKFRNTEFFTTDGEQITHVEVYFGSEVPWKSDEAEIRQLIDATVSAVRAKDAAALVKHYAPDVLAFDLIKPLQYAGVAEVEKRATEWFASWQGAIGYELRDLTVAPGDDTAFCHSLNHVSGTKTDGQSIDMWWRATVGCQKREGKWLVTHLHSSVPFDMGTGKASFDLKP